MPADSQNDSTTLIHNPSAADQATLTGSVLKNRYLLTRELTRGGFGIVYLAKDLQLHSRTVVVKVLLEKAFQSEYVVIKFHQEVEALSRIDHPGVIGIVDAGELSDGKPFLVMQYVDGVTLRSVLKPEGMDMSEVARIMRQIGRALTAAHEKGILHRDLKPENVMLQDLGHGEQQVKIIDFGIAKIKGSVVAPSTATSITAGTISYMAPEQLTGKPVSAATDVYAMAEMAYEMLTGRKPFNPETGFVLLELQREGVRIDPVDLRPGLPLPAQETILRSLSFDPQSRHRSAREFGDELAQTLEAHGTAGPTSSAEPAPTQLAPGFTPQRERTGGLTEKTVAATFPLNEPPFGSLAVSGGTTQSKPHRLRLMLIALAVVLLLFIAAGGYYFLYKRAATSPPLAETLVTRSFNYWLTVQKMRDGHPYQDEFDSSGQEIFENGWKFVMNLRSPDPGYLYLLNEGPAEGGASTYNVLFPTPSTNSGASFVSANNEVHTGWMYFDDHQGTEKFWVVWSATPVSELEAVRAVVNQKDKGVITDPQQATAVREFLTGHFASAKPEVDKDPTGKQTTVTGNGNLIVSFLELEHH